MITDALSILVIPYSRIPRINLRFLGILGFVFIGSLLACYIFQITEMTKASFFISEHENQIAEFSQESQSLEASFSFPNSLANLEIILSEMNYEEVGQVHYLRLPGSTVVAK